MKKVYIIYRSFFDMQGEQYMVGGIQTYIRQLAKLIEKKGYIAIIVQFAECNFKKEYNGIEVLGIDVKNKKSEQAKSKLILKTIKNRFTENDILIFASDDIFVHPFTDRVIVIQHGITWDLPIKKEERISIKALKKILWGWLHLIHTRKIKRMVCVDHNYINWIRAQGIYIDKKLYPIPNCTNLIYDTYKREENKIKIIFARRFETYRGTRIFAHAVKELLNKYSDVYVTFAGKGPDEQYLKELFRSNQQVNFITYESHKSLEIHKEYDIAVIPTLGSEGTSLSLLEAMACSCAVVTTNVGGLANIVLDRYNGLLIMPDEKLLIEALEELIRDREFRENIGKNAYLTVSKAFNKDIWEEKWGKVLVDVDNQI